MDISLILMGGVVNRPRIYVGLHVFLGSGERGGGEGG